MKKRKIEKKSEYEIWDIVFARDVDIRWMPWEYEIMSWPKHWLFWVYYKTRYNKKDYIHWLPDRHTWKIYKRKIEWVIVK